MKVLRMLSVAAAMTVAGAAAHASTVINVIGTTIDVTCSGVSDPACQGFSGGGSTVFPTQLGTLGLTATLYTGVASGESLGTVNSQADALNVLAGTSFLETDGTRTDTGGVDTASFFSNAAYIAFKLGGGTFFIANSAPGPISFFYDKDGQTAGGLSHITEFGQIDVIPLPAAGWMLLAGVGGLAAMRRRKKAA